MGDFLKTAIYQMSNPPATVPITLPATTTPTNIKSVIDMMLAQQMMSLLQGGGLAQGISWQRISEMIVMMSLEDVKSAILNTISTIKNLIATNHTTLWTSFVEHCGSTMDVIRYILYGWIVVRLRKFRQPVQQLHMQQLQDYVEPAYKNQHVITFATNPIFGENLGRLAKTTTCKS
jgi:hypothetical protein